MINQIYTLLICYKKYYIMQAKELQPPIIDNVSILIFLLSESGEKEIMKVQNKKTEKTKEKIITALIELMQIKNIKQINVSELCREAQINRSTFYLHYHDIADLLEKTKNETIETLLIKVKANKNQIQSIHKQDGVMMILTYQDILNAFRNVEEKKALVTSLLSDQGDPQFYNELRHELRDLMRFFLDGYMDELRETFQEIPEDYLEVILFDTIVNIIMLWMEKGMVESSEEIAQVIIASFSMTPLALLSGKKIS